LEKFISTFRLNYSDHQEMNDDDITYVQVYIVELQLTPGILTFLISLDLMYIRS
jgi:hypothetical protein